MKNSGSQHPTLTPTRLSDVGLMPIHTHGVSRENVTPYTTRCEQQQKKGMEVPNSCEGISAWLSPTDSHVKLFDIAQWLYLDMHIYRAVWHKWANKAKPDFSFNK